MGQREPRGTKNSRPSSQGFGEIKKDLREIREFKRHEGNKLKSPIEVWCHNLKQITNVNEGIW
ncbi:hypothetical protein NECAME_10080 [Necator americanus]|uniref:Uncharacterized protein n=1 Tax=Necator americanus TaxID=51031 RepID=W2TA07_NECAM|nr:hypothetical protein NECAME_10080 [Necator americanus]ETN78855.1 hypothetical protein NECAME_10080 [Necator americanus]